MLCWRPHCSVKLHCSLQNYIKGHTTLKILSATAKLTCPAHFQLWLQYSSSDALLPFCYCLSTISITQKHVAQTRCWAPLPLSADAVAGLPITDVANQQSFLGAVLDRTNREVQLVREVQNSSSTYSSDWHNKLFPFCDAGELVEIILQGKKRSQHSAFSTIPVAEEKLLFSMTLTVAFNNVIVLFTLMTLHSSIMTWKGLLTCKEEN